MIITLVTSVLRCAITNVRKVEMHESKLVRNSGQFYTLFSLYDRKNYSDKMKIID